MRLLDPIGYGPTRLHIELLPKRSSSPSFLSRQLDGYARHDCTADADVYAGKLHPRLAVGLAPLMHLQLRVLEKTDLEKRLARVDRLLRESIALIV